MSAYLSTPSCLIHNIIAFSSTVTRPIKNSLLYQALKLRKSSHLDNMDDTGLHYGKWNKQDIENQSTACFYLHMKF